MSDTDLEDRIANELCDVLDEPEAYMGCVLGINKKTLEVTVASPQSLTKDACAFYRNRQHAGYYSSSAS